MRELTAAGITDPALQAAYLRCVELHRRHGRTYFLATRLLPADRRPAVHALYGFARYADELVDGQRDIDAVTRLKELRGAVEHGDPALIEDPIGRDVIVAVTHASARFSWSRSLFGAFLDSMASDLTVIRYRTYDDLCHYMHGSAAAIGLLMLPILGTPGPIDAAEPYARDLGVAFQLTNFIRDVGEDLSRGRIYLPGEDLRYFGVGEDDLAEGAVTPAVRALLTHEIGRARGAYRAARPGINLLAAESRACVRTAFHLYAGILCEIERRDYQVFDQRATVSALRRLGVAVPQAGMSLFTRRLPR